MIALAPRRYARCLGQTTVTSENGDQCDQQEVLINGLSGVGSHRSETPGPETYGVVKMILFALFALQCLQSPTKIEISSETLRTGTPVRHPCLRQLPYRNHVLNLCQRSILLLRIGIVPEANLRG